MPTIKEKLYFNFDGVSCRNFGLMHVNLDSGMFEEQIHASREINETAIKGSDTPLFHSVEESPLGIELALAFTRKFTDKELEDVILWLFQESYKPLFFEDKPDRIFHCLAIGDPKLFHNGLKDGYVTIQMRCKSSKIVSPMIVSPLYDLSTNQGKHRVNISNSGHVEIYPEISIEKIGAGNITFTNVSNGNKIFEIRDLTNLEKIYVNCEKEIIQSDAIGVYRYDKVIGEYLNMMLKRGVNNIDIEGRAKITFRYIYKYKF